MLLLASVAARTVGRGVPRDVLGSLTSGSGPQQSPSACPRCRLVMQMSEMEWRKRKQQEGKDGSLGAALPAPSAQPPQRRGDLSDVDDLEFFGAVGGGTLTREGIANAQKVTTSVFDHETRLQEAVEQAGQLPPKEAVENLQNVIGEAYSSGLTVNSPPMKMAATLLQALEQAVDEGVDAEIAEVDPLDDKMDVLFADEYFVPDLD